MGLEMKRQLRYRSTIPGKLAELGIASPRLWKSNHAASRGVSAFAPLFPMILFPH
jgi:hypothetical protein